MKRKNKFAIGFWIVSTLSVVLAIALVGVIAAFTGKTTSGFRITYEAGANVNAKIIAEYKQTTKTDYATTGFAKIQRDGSTEEFVSFSTSDTDEDVQKSFKTVEIEKIGKDDCILIHYNIENRSSSNPLTLVAETTSTKNDNVKIEYALTNTSTTTWSTTLTDVINSEEIDPSSSLDFYVRISVSVTTQHAEFDGSFIFKLDAVD